jgi:hypothetical protein
MRSIHLINRRLHNRTPAGYMVQLQPVAGSLSDEVRNSHSYVTRDLSDGGMQLVADRHLPLHTNLLLTFEKREKGWDIVTSCAGLVVWVSPQESDGHFLVGIKFDETHA